MRYDNHSNHQSHRFFCSQEQSLSGLFFYTGLMFSLNVSAIGLTLFTLGCNLSLCMLCVNCGHLWNMGQLCCNLLLRVTSEEVYGHCNSSQTCCANTQMFLSPLLFLTLLDKECKDPVPFTPCHIVMTGQLCPFTARVWSCIKERLPRDINLISLIPTN